MCLLCRFEEPQTRTAGIGLLKLELTQQVTKTDPPTLQLVVVTISVVYKCSLGASGSIAELGFLGKANICFRAGLLSSITPHPFLKKEVIAWLNKGAICKGKLHGFALKRTPKHYSFCNISAMFRTNLYFIGAK